MKNITILLFCFLLFMVNFEVPLVCAESKFRDIGNTHWAREEIEYLSNRNVISGYYGGDFAPDEVITREQAALLLGRALDIGINGTSSIIKYLINLNILDKEAATNRNEAMTRKEMAKALSVAYTLQGTQKLNFNDVSVDNGYYPYIDALAQFEISKGYKDGTFRPNSPVTRAQFCVFVTKAIKLNKKAIVESVGNVTKPSNGNTSGETGKSIFKDIGDSFWAREEIEFLYNRKIISGYSGDMFSPNEIITRAQAALMLGRIMNIDVSGNESKSIARLIFYNMMGEIARNQRSEAITRKELARAISVAYDLKATNTFNFSDVSKHDPYYKYINNITQIGVIDGLVDGGFKPEAPVTRAQFCVFMTKAIKLGLVTTLNDRARVIMSKEEIVNILGEPDEKHYRPGWGPEQIWVYTREIDKLKLPIILKVAKAVRYIQLEFFPSGRLRNMRLVFNHNGTFSDFTKTITESLNIQPSKTVHNKESIWSDDAYTTYTAKSKVFIDELLLQVDSSNRSKKVIIDNYIGLQWDGTMVYTEPEVINPMVKYWQEIDGVYFDITNIR
ncbi:S-layer homology domain-containing protein [Bacillus sp. CGMCC 1.16607]|uniref:S-layer homology domain-containing protein n=1 Tax=Bacillus sp. CGMCC 1.16607 TaxID=3351842 RepID=UPI0036418443